MLWLCCALRVLPLRVIVGCSLCIAWHSGSSGGAAQQTTECAWPQAMDRCHRIGQRRPVLVLRLATAHSVEGRLLARARSKLALERLLIKKGGVVPGEQVALNPRPHSLVVKLALERLGGPVRGQAGHPTS